MLVGSSTSHKIQVVTSTTGDIEVATSVIAVSTATPPVVDGSQLLALTPASITTATTTDVVTGAASLIKRVMEQSYRNNAGTAMDVTVQRTDGTNTDTVMKCTLLGGEALVYNGAIWLHYDSNGAVYPSVGNRATQAEMEAGTATDKYVTPQGVNWHPGVAKFWVIFTGNSTTITASWNMTSITDGATQATVTIATDFSSTAWCCQATAIAAAATAAGTRLASALTLAATSVIVFCVDGAATTALQDPTSWCVTGFGDQA